MDELVGHSDPALALRVHRQSMRHSEGERARLRALVEGREVADSGDLGCGRSGRNPWFCPHPSESGKRGRAVGCAAGGGLFKVWWRCADGN
jgi:hypothetical protein